jgi:hypothetical protein
MSTIEYGCQTVANRKNSQASVDSPIVKKRVEINPIVNKQPSISKYKKDKNKAQIKGQSKEGSSAQLQIFKEKS